LAKARHKVTIYEAEDYVGGLASGFKEPGWDWWVEKYYHHWFASDRHMLGLIRELGWDDKLLFPRPYTVMYHEGKFYPFDSILKAILFPGLGWGVDKIRFGLVGLYLRLTNNWRPLEQFTVDAWMRKWAGDKVYELMWQPLVVGKFGERYYKQVTMAWMWARLKARTTRLGTFEGGFQNFADMFADRLREMGVEIRLQTPVTRIEREAGSSQVSVRSEVTEVYDQALVTLSPEAMTRLVPSLPEEYLHGLRSMKSMGAVVMVLALEHQLSEEGYYWYNLPKSAGYPFLALVEHTNYVGAEHFGGDRIVYMGDYLEPEHEFFRLSQEELLERFLPALKKFNPKFERDWVRKAWLFRTGYAQPVPRVGHSQNIPPIATPVEGVYFASMSQVYPWDRGTNFAVEIGRRAARMMSSEQ
ncbi:NAD(P)/FAD-dependent oxidoreductase, partial [bacterium]|nr:NAD(P)/FAD-dependent oxidoreductase [bacterium]